MTEYPYHKTLRLKNFTAFQEAYFEFVPGVNVFVGENGTGKTHVMKALYAMQLSQSRETRSIGTTLEDLFQTKDVADVVRMGPRSGAEADVDGIYDGRPWIYTVQKGYPTRTPSDDYVSKPERPVFIPAIDMMGHTKGFTEAYEEVRLDFDLTCRDVVNLLRLERKNGKPNLRPDTNVDKSLARLLDGEIERDDQGRFYLVNFSAVCRCRWWRRGCGRSLRWCSSNATAGSHRVRPFSGMSRRSISIRYSWTRSWALSFHSHAGEFRYLSLPTAT